MDINIGKYNLTNDERQYIVSEIKTVQEGKSAGSKIKSNQTYHPTIESAIIGIMGRKIKESDAATLAQLRNDVQAAKMWVVGCFDDTRLSFNAAWDEAHRESA